ncbi:MAG TPA: hypothetical protein VGP76_22580 [Planctomycetaceae bacterium]|nr:hypothetical protein [Planctomycetaceae bacterium]
MDPQTLHIAFGPGALDFLIEQLRRNPPGDALFTFPDYTIRFYCDPSIPGSDGRLDHVGTRQETRVLMAYSLPNGILPPDVTTLVNLSFEEILRCYERDCYLAAVALCGRTIETVVGGVYQQLKGVHPSDEQGSKPGIRDIIKYLGTNGYQFPPGTKEKIDAIALHRNMAIHGNLVIPTVDEARSVIYLTKDVLRIAAERAAQPPTASQVHS